jgi:hypothetical protein
MYPDEERQAYSEPATAEPSAQVIMNLREQMEPEEKTRFDRQIESEYQKLIVLVMSIYSFKPSLLAFPMLSQCQQFRKMKTHGQADPRVLPGTETAALDLKAREALARNKAVVTPESPFRLRDDDDEVMLLETPPKLAGESQGGTSISLALLPSPEQPRRRPAPAPFFRLPCPSPGINSPT